MAATLAGQAPFALKYLFIAYFADGSVITQTPEDRSTLDPTKSAFYDVLQKTGLAQFALHGDGRACCVDLRSGIFDINGLEFEAQPCASDEMPPGGTFRLIYFRDHRQEMNVSDLALGEHHIAYRFGWEYTVGDKTWVQTLVLR